MTNEQKQNLIKLARYLWAGKFPCKFDLTVYHAGDDDIALDIDLIAKGECGTHACAIGLAPYAGIPLDGDFSWSRYSSRVFGVDIFKQPELFTWLFGSEWSWSPADKSAIGVAGRIVHYLTTDYVPSEEECTSIRYETLPLPYTTVGLDAILTELEQEYELC